MPSVFLVYWVKIGEVMVDKQGKPDGETAVEFSTGRARENGRNSVKSNQSRSNKVDEILAETSTNINRTIRGDSQMDNLEKLIQALHDLEKQLSSLENELEVCAATYKKSMEMLESEIVIKDFYEYVDENAYQSSKLFLNKLREKIAEQDLVVVKSIREQIQQQQAFSRQRNF